MNPIGYVPDRHFVAWPAWKEWLKKVTANLPMKVADAIHRSTSADRQVCHVKTLRRIVRISATQRQQIAEPNPELLFGVVAQVLLYESGRKTIETGRPRGVCRKQISSASDGQRSFERLRGRAHEATRAFKDGECRMAFV
jgi:hypothetical protein